MNVRKRWDLHECRMLRTMYPVARNARTREPISSWRYRVLYAAEKSRTYRRRCCRRRSRWARRCCRGSSRSGRGTRWRRPCCCRTPATPAARSTPGCCRLVPRTAAAPSYRRRRPPRTPTASNGCRTSRTPVASGPRSTRPPVWWPEARPA